MRPSAVPDAIASQCPRSPHAHIGPSMSTVKWPISAPKLCAPRYMRPSSSMPPPMPVPSVTSRTCARAARRAVRRPRRASRRWRRCRRSTAMAGRGRERVAQRRVADVRQVRRVRHAPVAVDEPGDADADRLVARCAAPRRSPRRSRRARRARRAATPGAARGRSAPSASSSTPSTLVPPMSSPIVCRRHGWLRRASMSMRRRRGSRRGSPSRAAGCRCCSTNSSAASTSLRIACRNSCAAFQRCSRIASAGRGRAGRRSGRGPSYELHDEAVVDEAGAARPSRRTRLSGSTQRAPVRADGEHELLVGARRAARRRASANGRCIDSSSASPSASTRNGSVVREARRGVAVAVTALGEHRQLRRGRRPLRWRARR